jgi:hypothetical protein
MGPTLLTAFLICVAGPTSWPSKEAHNLSFSLMRDLSGPPRFAGSSAMITSTSVEQHI